MHIIIVYLCASVYICVCVYCVYIYMMYVSVPIWHMLMPCVHMQCICLKTA